MPELLQLDKPELTEAAKALVVGGIPESDLALFYPALHGRGGLLLDRSQNGNSGTISGAVWSRFPRGLKVLDFNGTSHYVSCGNPASLQIVAALTIEAWISPDTVSGNDSIVHKYDAGGGQRAFTLYLSAGIPTFVVSSALAPFTGGVRAGATTLTAGTLYHLVAVFDPSANLDIYLNGALDNGALTGAIPASIANTTRSLLLGAGYNNSATPNVDWFDGRIGLVIVRTRALTATQVSQRYTRSRLLVGA